MWLIVAQRRVAGTADEGWISDLLNGAMSVATPDQRATARRWQTSARTLARRISALPAVPI